MEIYELMSKRGGIYKGIVEKQKKWFPAGELNNL